MSVVALDQLNCLHGCCRQDNIKTYMGLYNYGCLVDCWKLILPLNKDLICTVHTLLHIYSLTKYSTTDTPGWSKLKITKGFVNSRRAVIAGTVIWPWLSYTRRSAWQPAAGSEKLEPSQLLYTPSGCKPSWAKYLRTCKHHDEHRISIQRSGTTALVNQLIVWSAARAAPRHQVISSSTQQRRCLFHQIFIVIDTATSNKVHTFSSVHLCVCVFTHNTEAVKTAPEKSNANKEYISI